VLLLDSDLATSFSFRLSGFDGRREVRRSRGVGIELTDGVDWEQVPESTTIATA
jgi:hypothetical protein